MTWGRWWTVGNVAFSLIHTSTYSLIFLTVFVCLHHIFFFFSFFVFTTVKDKKGTKKKSQTTYSWTYSPLSWTIKPPRILYWLGNIFSFFLREKEKKWLERLMKGIIIIEFGDFADARKSFVFYIYQSWCIYENDKHLHLFYSSSL